MSSLPSDLLESLRRVADQYTHNAPEAVFRVFPNWRTELYSIVLSQNEAQLQTAVQGLQGEVAKSGSAFSPYHFALHALNAAIEVHTAYNKGGAVGAAAATVTTDFLSQAAARSIVVEEVIRPELLTKMLSQGWRIRCEPPRACASDLPPIDAKDKRPDAVRELLSEGWQMVCEPPSSPKRQRAVLATPVLATPAATSQAAAAPAAARADVVREVLAAAPAAVRQAFPDFEAELRAMLSRPEEELRSTAQKLSVALADLEVRCFTDSADAATHLEAQAMAFGVSAMSAVLGGDASLASAARGRGEARPAVVTARRVQRPKTPDFLFRSLGSRPASPSSDIDPSALPDSSEVPVSPEVSLELLAFASPLELEVARMSLTQAVELCDMQAPLELMRGDGFECDLDARSASNSSVASKAPTVLAAPSFGRHAAPTPSKPTDQWRPPHLGYISVSGNSLCRDEPMEMDISFPEIYYNADL